MLFTMGAECRRNMSAAARGGSDLELGNEPGFGGVGTRTVTARVSREAVLALRLTW